MDGRREVGMVTCALCCSVVYFGGGMEICLVHNVLPKV